MNTTIDRADALSTLKIAHMNLEAAQRAFGAALEAVRPLCPHTVGETIESAKNRGQRFIVKRIELELRDGDAVSVTYSGPRLIKNGTEHSVAKEYAFDCIRIVG